MALFNVSFFCAAAFGPETEKRKKAVEEAFEAEEGTDEEEEDYACYDTYDDTRDGPAAEAVVGCGGHAGCCVCGGWCAKGDGCCRGSRRGKCLHGIACGAYEGGGGVGDGGVVEAADVADGVDGWAALALVLADLADGAADRAARGFLKGGVAVEACGCGRNKGGGCGCYLRGDGAEVGAVG